MAQFNVDSGQVSAAGAQAAAIAGQLRTDAAAMMAQVQALQGSGQLLAPLRIAQLVGARRKPRWRRL